MKEKMAAPAGGDEAGEASARKGKRKVKKKISKAAAAAASEDNGPAARPFELDDLQAFHEEALEVSARCWLAALRLGSSCFKIVCRRRCQAAAAATDSSLCWCLIFSDASAEMK